MVESERHIKYKMLLRSFFNHFQQKSYDYLFEEFQVGPYKFDLVSYPPIEIEDFKIIGMECGNVESNCHKNFKHFSIALRFVHQIIWIPYDITAPPFMDLVNSSWNNLIFIKLLLTTSNPEYNICNNTFSEDTFINKIGGVIITIKGRDPDYDELYQQQIEGKFSAFKYELNECLETKYNKSINRK